MIVANCTNNCNLNSNFHWKLKMILLLYSLSCVESTRELKFAPFLWPTVYFTERLLYSNRCRHKSHIGEPAQHEHRSLAFHRQLLSSLFTGNEWPHKALHGCSTTSSCQSGLCVLGGLCVDMWRLVHQWSFLLFWLSFGTIFDCFWLFLTIGTLLVQSW